MKLNEGTFSDPFLSYPSKQPSSYEKLYRKNHNKSPRRVKNYEKLYFLFLILKERVSFSESQWKYILFIAIIDSTWSVVPFLLIRKFALDFTYCCTEIRLHVTNFHMKSKELAFLFVILLLSCLTAQIINSCRSTGTETGNDILLLHVRPYGCSQEQG